jgi:hypothetical protein
MGRNGTPATPFLRLGSGGVAHHNVVRSGAQKREWCPQADAEAYPVKRDSSRVEVVRFHRAPFRNDWDCANQSDEAGLMHLGRAERKSKASPLEEALLRAYDQASSFRIF